jgi:hypothetical protein
MYKMKMKFLIALSVLSLVSFIWAATSPSGSGNPQSDLHGDAPKAKGANPIRVDHGWEPAASDGEPESAVFTQDLGGQNGTQNGAQATPLTPYGAKTVKYNGESWNADGSHCVVYTHVQDIQHQPFWLGMLTVITFCCENMGENWGPDCWWTVEYRWLTAWIGTSGEISDEDLAAILAQPSHVPGLESNGPRQGKTQ